MRVLDTDLITILMHGPPLEQSKLTEKLDRSEDDIAVTIISFEEQVRGWMTRVAKAKAARELVYGYIQLSKLLEAYRHFTVVDFDDGAAEQFAQLRRTYRRHGAFDLKIAAIAITRNVTLLTRNLRDFADIQGLSVEDPLAL